MKMNILIGFLCLSSMSAFAYDFTVDGICYTITPKPIPNTVEVTYNPDKSFRFKYYNGDLEIPEKVNYNGETYTVTSIGSYAFMFCDELKSVKLPKTIKTIKKYAFDSSGLNSINIPNSVKAIDTSAFGGCMSLSSIEIPSSVSYLGPKCFENNGLESISLPPSIKEIKELTFQACHSLKSITIPSSIEKIEKDVFLNCTSLAAFNVDPNNKNFLSKDGVLFSKNKKTLIRYPHAKVGAYTIPFDIDSINSEAFMDCMELTTLSFPKTLKYIGVGAFGYSGLCSVIFPTSLALDSIGDGAFAMSKLVSVNIPSTIYRIGNVAFGNCSELREVTIPSSVKTIGYLAFRDCKSLRVLYLESEEPINLSSSKDVFKGVDTKNCILYVPKQSVNLYKKANQWGAFEQIVGR